MCSATFTFVALGSSIVGVHGGCTAPAPLLARGCKCPLCCGTACGHFRTEGFARGVLRAFQREWPHPQHVMYNLGVPGGTFVPLINACPATFLGFEVDVVLADLLTTADSDHERLVRGLLSRTPPPLVLNAEFWIHLVDQATGHTANGNVCPAGVLRNGSETLLRCLMRSGRLPTAEEALRALFESRRFSDAAPGGLAAAARQCEPTRTYLRRALHARRVFDHYELPTASTLGTFGLAWEQERRAIIV